MLAKILPIKFFDLTVLTAWDFQNTTNINKKNYLEIPSSIKKQLTIYNGLVFDVTRENKIL